MDYFSGISVIRNHYARISAISICCVGIMCMGIIGCDQNAQADFRKVATPKIADGIKTILDALVDGAATAIINAGDGTDTSSSSGGSS